MKSGAELIAQERARQISEEGWDSNHDDNYNGEGQLAMAAACYAVDKIVYEREEHLREVKYFDLWPWDDKHDKREDHDSKKRLIIAGALIAAEIDRIQRAEDE